MIDIYVDMQPELNEVNSRFQSVINIIPQKAVALLSSMYSLSDKVMPLRGEAQLQLGSFFNLLARYNTSDMIPVWCNVYPVRQVR